MAYSLPAKEKLPSGDQLNMVLVGKTGQGKSETGNTILGQYLFDSSDGVSSNTQINQVHTKNVGGRILKVVDTPGCMDTKKGARILNEIAGAVAVSPEGYDAFLMVFRYPLRMTEEERKCVDQLEMLFGEDIYNYTVVIFTHGDNFTSIQKKNKRDGKPVLTFQEYVEKDLLSNNRMDSLGPLLRKVNQRVLLFDNMEDDENKRRQMVTDLVKMIDNNGKSERYDDRIFQKARSLKEKGLPSDDMIAALVEFIISLLGRVASSFCQFL